MAALTKRYFSATSLGIHKRWNTETKGQTTRLVDFSHDGFTRDSGTLRQKTMGGGTDYKQFVLGFQTFISWKWFHS